MKRCIDVDELKKHFINSEDSEYARWTLDGILMDIDDFFSEDEVKCGNWEQDIEVDPFSVMYFVQWKCSVCGHKKRGRWVNSPLYSKPPKDNYCSNCGTRMKYEEK